jgi:phenylacetate-CoA ligase
MASLLAMPLYTRQRVREQWLSPSSLARVRSQRLREVLQRARAASYYGRVLPEIPVHQSDEDVLAQLPLLDKRILTDEGLEAFLTPGSGELVEVATSGSTGHPAKFLRSPIEETEFSARMYRAYSAYGCTARDKILNIGSTARHRRIGAVTVLRDLGILPKVLNVFVGTPAQESVRILLEFEPRLIVGYAVGIENIADYIVRNRVEVKPPVAVACGAMDVSDHCRDLAEQAFQAPAMNIYVSNELGLIAWECPEQRGSLHVNEDMLVMEILDSDGQPVPDGSIGEVVLTSLTLNRMPLIRYRMGDTAARIAEPCRCGRGLGLMTRVQGRTAHTIVSPDGRLFTAVTMGSIFKAARAYEWVRRFQVREEENYLILILVEPHREPSEAQTGNLLAEMEKILDAPYSFRLEMRDELPLAPSGKYQYLVPLSP